ncbi:HTH domain-containing protein [Mycobacterium sp. Z3061]|uniref:HTH domain-containing protein n=1 Tax=Mycobacterium sp. Z3061 TaxID=3073562 RepID=UPI0028735520|nr:HTH domain-containing protein [Mycobacterium sp. Z3061]
MADMPWREAIVKVLQDSGIPMHYAEIAQAIIDSGYRVNVGATPAATVAANLSESIRSRKRSPFVKVERGVYALRVTGTKMVQKGVEEADEAREDAREMGLINAFGMFWDRDRVQWKPAMPRLLGVQQSGSAPVNFTAQAGVYILYDGSRAIYVGRITEPRLGLRLFDHTRDRLTGRWNRFSWFGVRGVREDGELSPMPTLGIAVQGLIATMEALLIEGLEPPQNRKQGDGFNALEFIQETDPEVVRERDRRVLAQLSDNIGLT